MCRVAQARQLREPDARALHALRREVAAHRQVRAGLRYGGAAHRGHHRRAPGAVPALVGRRGALVWLPYVRGLGYLFSERLEELAGTPTGWAARWSSSWSG
jgi:hypothetical protein